MNALRKADNERFKQGLRQLGRWLAPGLGIKRWFFLVLAGITLFGVGTAIFLYDIYHTESNNQTWVAILSYASLSFLPRFLRVLIFGGLGVGLAVGLFLLSLLVGSGFASQAGVDHAHQVAHMRRALALA